MVAAVRLPATGHAAPGLSLGRLPAGAMMEGVGVGFLGRVAGTVVVLMTLVLFAREVDHTHHQRTGAAFRRRLPYVNGGGTAAGAQHDG